MLKLSLIKKFLSWFRQEISLRKGRHSKKYIFDKDLWFGVT